MEELMEEIKNIDLELVRLEDRMENYIPEPDNPEVIKIFCDLLDKKEIEISGKKLKPSVVLKKCEPVYFEEKLIDFRRIMEEDTLLQISEYREIVSEYKNLKKKKIDFFKKLYSHKQNNRFKVFNMEDFKKIAIEKVNADIETENIICIKIDDFGYVLVDFEDFTFYYMISSAHIPEKEIADKMLDKYIDEEKNFLFSFFTILDSQYCIKSQGYSIMFNGKNKNSTPFDSDFQWPIDEFQKIVGSHFNN